MIPWQELHGVEHSENEQTWRDKEGEVIAQVSTYGAYIRLYHVMRCACYLDKDYSTWVQESGPEVRVRGKERLPSGVAGMAQRSERPWLSPPSRVLPSPPQLRASSLDRRSSGGVRMEGGRKTRRKGNIHSQEKKFFFWGGWGTRTRHTFTRTCGLIHTRMTAAHFPTRFPPLSVAVCQEGTAFSNATASRGFHCLVLF